MDRFAAGCAFAFTDHGLNGSWSALAKNAQGLRYWGFCAARCIWSVAFACIGRLSSVVSDLGRPQGRAWSRHILRRSSLFTKRVLCALTMRRMLLGHDLHRQRRWPWLHVPFRTVFRYFGHACRRLVTFFTLGGVRVSFRRAHAWGTSGNPVFNLLVRPWPLSLTRIIVGSWRRRQGARQNVETEIGSGKRGVLAGLCFARIARIRRPIPCFHSNSEGWP